MKHTRAIHTGEVLGRVCGIMEIELEAFVRAIHTGEEPECSGRNNLGTLALVVAAVELPFLVAQKRL